MRKSISLAAAFLSAALLHSPLASAQQSGLGGHYGGTIGYQNYLQSGGNEAIRQGWLGGAQTSASFANYMNGGDALFGQGAGKAAFGFLSASAHAQAYVTNGGNYAQSNFSTWTYWFDQLTILTPGQLVFSLSLSDRLALNSAPTRPDCYAFLGQLSSDRSDGNCAFAGAQFEVNGNLGASTRFQNTTGSQGVSAWPNQGPQVVDVFAGEIIPIAAFLRVSAGGCVATAYLPDCLDNGGDLTQFASGDADASATFFIDEVGGATYADDSGVQYNAQVTAAPEPSSILLTATGLLCLWGAARRAKRA